MKGLTKRQKKVYDFISNFIYRNKYSPSIREIAGYFNMSPRGAFDHVFAIEKKGYIHSEHGKARTITILRGIV
jgi:repressor LexA